MVGMAETVPVGVRAWVNGTMPALPEDAVRRQHAVLSRSAKSTRAEVCRKAADYMPPTESLTRHAVPRVIIDTNVALDWLVFAQPAALALADAVARRRWVWCATPAMLVELRAVLNRPLAERWEDARKLALTRELDPLVSWMPMTGPLPAASRLVCRDPADQMFIDLALTCAPSWLVTRDRALLALRRQAIARGVMVVTPEQWLRTADGHRLSA
jgi:putative PIN family toxin of toxin-antitoxin system